MSSDREGITDKVYGVKRCPLVIPKLSALRRRDPAKGVFFDRLTKMRFEKEDRIREATLQEVRLFYQNASERDWDGSVPPFIDWGRLLGCDGFTAAEYQGDVIGAIATSSQGMDGSALPTIANVYVLREFSRRGVGRRMLVDAIERLLAAGNSQAYCKAITVAMARTIGRLPQHLRQCLEFTVDLRENWLAPGGARAETRGLD